MNIREYYRGMKVTATGSFFSNYVMLNVNNILKKTAGVIDERGKTIEGKQFQGAMCSALAGFIMAVFWNPIELSQVIQGQGKSLGEKRSLVQAARDIYARGRVGGKGPISGFLNFWTGFSGTAMRDTLYAGMIFGISPYIRRYFDSAEWSSNLKKKYPLLMTGVSALSCGLLVGAVTIPIDNFRTVIQASCLNDTQLGMRSSLRNIYDGKVVYNAEKRAFQNYLDITLPNGEKSTYNTPTGIRGILRGGVMRIVRIGMCGFVILFTREFMREKFVKEGAEV